MSLIAPATLAAPPAALPIHTPDWVKNAIFYEIFPDRFARSSRTTHLPGLRFQQWGSPPTVTGFQGGDLRGIVDKLDYLTQLGINAIYLTPIFTSASTHRYHTYDYLHVDPLLGGDDALKELLEAMHERGMKLVLDGVFNHTGRGFWAFHHILENGGDSPYLDWFTIHGYPLRPYPENPKQPINYSAWWNLPDLPKLNTKHPAVREYLLEVAQHWIRFGVDGWRLDVPHEIDDDDFWRTFRQVVKQENPEAYICGEIWREARRWLQGDQFDGVMNYLFTGPTISFFAARTFRNDYKHPNLPIVAAKADQLAAQIEQMYGYYDWEINYAQLNMMGSHDMARIHWITQDLSASKLCVLFQMTMPGAPCIYYGDEVGLSGGPDPDCRAAFPWHDESSWNYELLTFFRRATALRTTLPALRTGDFRILHAKEELFIFARRLADQVAIVAFNAAETDAIASVPAAELVGRPPRQVWPLEEHIEFEVRDSQLQLFVPAREALVLVT